MNLLNYRLTQYFGSANNLKQEYATYLKKTAYEQVNKPICEKAFLANGQPSYNVDMDNVIYPSQAGYLLATPIAWEFANIEPEYSESASKAVWQYLKNWLNIDSPFSRGEDYADGYLIERDGYKYMIPLYDTTPSNEVISPYLVIADVPEDDEYWENNQIPIWILHQARLTMALIKEHSGNLSLAGMYIVRVSGNLTADIDIRWIPSNTKMERDTLARCDSVIASNLSQNKYSVPPIEVMDKRNWAEIMQERIDTADEVCDDALYEDICTYMAIRSERKTLEKESADIKKQEDAIAIQLASEILDSESGEIENPADSRIYTVKHSKSRTYTPKITPNLVRIIAPEYSDAITVNETVKGRVDIDVL